MKKKSFWRKLSFAAFALSVFCCNACFAVDSPPSLSNANWLSMEFPSSTSGSITATVCDPSGNLYICGSFKTKDVNNPIPFGVAKWDGTKWTPFLSGADDSVAVYSVVYSSGTIYASGYFTSSADSATFSFAKWSGTKWIPLGTDYGSYNLITCDSSGNLYAKASFKTKTNVPFCFGKWDVSTSTWIPLGTNSSAVDVNAIVCDLSGNLYAGGVLDGTNSSVARWNGTTWSQLGTLNGSVNTLAFDSLGKLYAGGMLFDGSNNSFGVAKWDGSKWNFIGGKGFFMHVNTLAFDSSSNLYAGGYITNIADGIPANNIARWDGSTWSAIGSGTGSTINSLSYSSAKLLNTGGNFTTKLLYVGGDFTTAGGKSSNKIAKLIFPPPPGAPTAVTAARGDTKATVSFTQPVPNGEFPLTSFEVTSSPEGIKATGSASPIAVTRLTNGKSYTFTVKATNAIGPFGPASAASIIPVIPATVPDVPTKVIATPGNGQASVAFTAPFNEGSAITGYTVTSDPGGILKTGTASPIIVTGLTNGVAYTFSVTATNALGISEPSDASASVIPAIPITAIGAITGTVKVDSVLTAGAVTPTGATVKYQWMRCVTATDATGVSIGENKNTYTAVAADAGKFIKVQVTGIGGYSGIKLSAATTAVPTPLSGLAIIGTVGVGQILTAMPSQSTATATYQWSSCATDVGETYANIAGATANTYTPTLAVVAKYLKVTATGIGSYSGTVTSDPTATAVPTPPTPITAIGTITGTAKVGSELTAGAVTPAGATVYYMWMRCASSTATTGDDIGYNPTYTVMDADVGKFIKVKARGTVNYDGIVTSTATAAVFKPIEIEKISPTSRRDVSIGMEFIAGNVLPAKATFTYQWSYCSESASGTYLNVTSGGTSNTLFYPRSEKYFKVTVTGTGIYSGSVTSDPVYSKAAAITNIGAISGTANVGSVLTAGALTPAGATVTYDWQTAPAVTGTWTSTGSTANTYTVAAGDKTKFIRVVATGNGGYINSAISAVTTAVPTPITAIGTIGGTQKVGATLTAGTLTPATATVTYQWQSAAISGGPYSNIVGAIAKAYTLKATDVDKFIRIVVTGTGSYSGTLQSSETAAVAPILVTGIAAITGTAQTGSVLTAGALAPTTATVTYQWMRCGTATDVTGASIGLNQSTYLVDAADAGKFIKVQVTGIGGYSGIKLSAATTAVVPAPLTAIGTITGIVSVGSTLKAGALTPAAASAKATYQWERSSGATDPWTSIGDSSGTYTIKGPDDVGKTIRVKATATGYTKEVISLATKAVPKPITVPTIDGEKTVGKILTATANPTDATVSYQWKSAVTSGGSPSNISGATAKTYTLKASDADKYITVFTTGIGSYSGTLQSLETVVSPISVAGIGVITGTVKVGSLLTAGALTPTVATVKYQWTSCPVGGEYKNIDGATLRTYTVGATEISKFIKVVATGTGGYGGTATSEATTLVPLVPVTAIGAISGTVSVGSTLTAGALTPSGAVATATYTWLSSDTSGGTYASILGAPTTKTYVLQSSDAGKYIKVEATATGYTGTPRSVATGKVPTLLTTLTISAPSTVVGQILAATANPTEATVTYQWKRCNTSADGDTGVSITAATAQKYTLVAADVNKFIRVSATGIGNYSGTALSAATAAVSPISVTNIAITGTAQIGSVLTADAVIPSAATVTYQWTSCTRAGGEYKNIDGAKAKTYTVGAAELSNFIKVVATGTGGYGSSATSVATTAVSPMPLTTIGAISGTAKVDSELTAGAVTPAGATFDYQWMRCAAATDATGASIGENKNTYMVTAADATKYIRVQAIGKACYVGTVTSAATAAVPTPLSGLAISGTVRVDQILTAVPSQSAATVTYQWSSCDNAGGIYTPISGATAKTYTPTLAVVGKYLMVTATGTGSYSGTVASDPTATVVTAPVTAIGAIIGNAKVGSLLTAGTVTPAGATVTYDWQTAPTASGTWTSTGITEKTYTVAAGVKYIRVVATGTGNYPGSAISVSITTNVISIRNIGYTIGTMTVGSVLTAGPVTPAGATVTYDWQTSSDYKTFISTGITTNTYTVMAEDAGKYLRVVATGTGSYIGTESSLPRIVATPITGIGAIDVMDWSWDGLAIFIAGSTTPSAPVTYQWSLCDTVDGIYADIPEATGMMYKQKVTDTGKYIKVRAKAMLDLSYSGTVTSAAWGPLPYRPPITAIGAITGTVKVDSVLTAGAVTPAGATVTYDWQTAPSTFETWTSTGITTNTYIVTAGDEAKYIRVVATGTENFIIYAPYKKQSTATSTAVGPVATLIDSIGDITGAEFKVGIPLTAGAVLPGTATVTYQWSSCDNAVGIYANIVGATAKTYTPTVAVAAKYLKVTATGSGSYSGSMTSTPTATAITAPISAIGAITGTAKVGLVLTAGAVTPAGATVKYQWKRCNTAAVSDTGENIGTDQATYLVGDGDACKFIKVEVTGNGSYFGTKLSAATTAVPTRITAIGDITGTPAVGSILTAGEVVPGTATVTYQWSSCATAVGGTYADIAGATAKAYSPTVAVAAKYLKVTATGTGLYSGTAESVPTGIAVTAPITAIGTITGTAKVGSVLTAGAVTPAGATVIYQWKRCNTAAVSDTGINIGTDLATYLVEPADASKFIKVEVTGNGSYYGTKLSAATAVAFATAPSFTLQPSSRSVMAGDPALFRVTVTGTPAPTCLWQVSTDGAVTWTDLANDATHSGVTTTTMTVINTTAAISRYQFRCMATNCISSVPSNAAILRVESYDTDLAGTDDFTTDENWSAPTMSTSKRGLLTFTDDSLEYTVSSPSSENFVLREWTANVGSYSKNWEVQVNVHLAGSDLLNGQYANLNLIVVNAADATNSFASGMDNMNNMCVAIDRYSDGVQTVNNFEGDLNSYYTGNNTGLLESEPTSTTDAALRIRFNCDTKELSSWYATNINDAVLAWTLLQKVNIASGEDYDWGMTDNSTFAVFLVGEAGGGTDIDPVSVSARNAYFSNFLASTTNYLVIDLSGGSDALSYPISYLSALPNPIPDEYRKTKLAMKKITAGTFTMGSPSGELGRNSDETQHPVTLTNDFYIGVFEVTQKQWELVMGDWPSYFNNIAVREVRPVEQVSYDDIRGSAAGSGWPANSNVDATSFMGKLRQKTGIGNFDLPTEAQWEYACRAGTSTALNNGTNLISNFQDGNMDLLGRYYYNGGSSDSQGVGLDGATAKMGSYLPNEYGLYDMHGNVWEWSLDWWDGNAYPITAVTDPSGQASGGDRVMRGGSWNYGAKYCRSALRASIYQTYRNSILGFRLLGTVP